MSTLPIPPLAIHPRESIGITARPPLSRSIASRVLLLAALGEGESVFNWDERPREMYGTLAQLGVRMKCDAESGRLTVYGTGGLFPVKSAEIVLERSEITARFLTAALAFSDGSYRIIGKGRLAHLSMDDLLFALGQLGAEVRSELDNGNLPVRVSGIHARSGPSETLSRYGIASERSGWGGRFAALSGHTTSQYLSALLLAAPLGMKNGAVELHVVNELASRPFVRMSLALMREFGIDIQSSVGNTHVLLAKGFSFVVPQGSVYQPKQINIEPEAIAANALFAAAAICGGSARVPGLSESSLQADIDFVYCLRRMGCTVSSDETGLTVRRDPARPLYGVSVDMNELLDSVPLLGVVACFARTPTKITNIAALRASPDNDRIALYASELRKLGANVEELPDGLSITPNDELRAAEFDSHGDFRLAMSLPLAGLRIPGVVLHRHEAVADRWPGFFETLNEV